MFCAHVSALPVAGSFGSQVPFWKHVNGSAAVVMHAQQVVHDGLWSHAMSSLQQFVLVQLTHGVSLALG